MSWVLTVIVFLLVISALVAAHEYGHFLFARLCGMDVEEFAIGMGKPSWTFMRKKGTEYNLRAFPVGGFVRIKGMIPQEDGSEVNIENGFYSKSPYKRFLVLFAGPLFSILAGVLILIVLFTTVGEQVQPPVLGQMMAGAPAEKAGLQSGDTVLSVDGTKVSTWVDMANYIYGKANQPVDLESLRGKETIHKTVTVGRSNTLLERFDKEGMPTGGKFYPGMIGVSPLDDTVRMDKIPLREALGLALIAPFETGKGLVSTIMHPATFSDSAAGPATMINYTHRASSEGSIGQRIYQVLELAAALSMALGFMNLLPIVPLDGGQILVAIAEMFRRRRLSIQIQGVVNSVGFALVATLVVCVLWIDLKRFIVPAAPPKVLMPVKQQPAPVKPDAKAPAPLTHGAN
jgi:regulator of sigma E protease